MYTNNHRLQILASLDSMNQAQIEKVLAYIRGMSHFPSESRHQKLRTQALKEIRQALHENRPQGI